MILENLRNLAIKYDYSEGEFRLRRGASAGKLVPISKINIELIELGVELVDIADNIEILKEFCKEGVKKSKKNQEEDDWTEESILEICKAIDPFKNFFLVRNKTHDSDVVYYNNGEESTVAFSAAGFTAENVFKFLMIKEGDMLSNLQKELAPYINPKKRHTVSIIDALNQAIITLEPTTKTLKRFEVLSDPHPVTINECEIFSIKKILYIRDKSLTFKSMNPYLQDFLTRTHNHEYMCAILWANLIGLKLPYLIYLKGNGNDGKSTFVKMLGALTRSIANYDAEERFSYYNMFGKSIISLNENQNPKIMQSTILKSITGGDYVRVEGKGKDAFTGEIRGLLIINSNKDLELLGTDDERRRLRYFRVESSKLNSEADRLMPDEYFKRLSSTPNEFMNYMEKCYKKHCLKGGMIDTPSDHNDTINNMRDVADLSKFNHFVKSKVIGRGYIFDKSLSTECTDIIDELLKKFPNDKYIKPNFERYLIVDCGVCVEGRMYYGLGKPTKDHEITDKDIKEALPK